MFKDVRRSVRQVLSHARSEVSACFTDVTSITTCTGKFIYNARTEPIRERIFHVKQVLNFKGRENKFDVNRFAKFKLYACTNTCDRNIM